MSGSARRFVGAARALNRLGVKIMPTNVERVSSAQETTAASGDGDASLDRRVDQALTSALDRGNSRYQTSDFKAELSAMNDGDKQRLLGIIDRGQVPIKDAITMVDQFQRYYGYDNRQAASALREAYYPDLLNPFIEGAGSVDGNKVLNLDNGAQRGNAENRSDAALAQAVFKLSRQGDDYAEESVRITDRIDGQDQSIGFDHLIAGLDGQMNAQSNGPTEPVRTGVWALGGNPDQIRSVDAVTWLGDLAATVQIGAQQLSDPQRVGERVEARSPLERILNPGGSIHAPTLNAQTGPAALAGWNKEAPVEDRIGDVIGTGLDVNPDRHNLAATLNSAFDPKSEAFKQRYRNYADDVGLRYDSSTGAVSDADKQAFIDRHVANVDALGTGLFTKGQPGAVALFPEVLGATKDMARANLSRWVDEVEQKLNAEVAR
jgi:hypothetical protein